MASDKSKGRLRGSASIDGIDGGLSKERPRKDFNRPQSRAQQTRQSSTEATAPISGSGKRNSFTKGQS